ncbi:MAG: histidine kinase [Firmicutes bacterium HGW-Firmicutes-7]|nr:MAG: histidine kinase [Firmicutes bacterium HGW-Firmicutes-7]
MNEYLKLKKSNCKNCYKCIRHCPVKSISFSGNQAHIVEDECILCGMCFVACPQNAKEIRNDVEKAKNLLAGGQPIYASIAPSFVANYEGVNIEAMKQALKKLGFFAVEETAIGATIVKKEYEKLTITNKNDVIISSCCHTVNVLIQKHYPQVLPNLAKVISPMQAHCTKIKKNHPEALTIFIGPCISKKAEGELYKDVVDCVLTFEELSEWLQEENISFEKNIPEDTKKGKARLFPTAGGILRTMNCEQSDYSYVSIDGMENCIQAIKDIIDENISNCFIEMSACSGSCIGGPAMDKRRIAPVRDFITVNKYAGDQDFLVEPMLSEELRRSIPYVGLHRQIPGSKQIEEILKKMGKTQLEHELNCGSCGYNTCKEKATAVCMGKADLTMCLPFLKDKAETFSDNIINNSPNGIFVLNEDLKVQQMNSAACQIMNINRVSDVIGEPVVRILEPSIYMDVLASEKNVYNKQIYLAEYKRYVMETIIYDKSYHILMSIMRDITEEENLRIRKEVIRQKTMEITDNVIEKQMRTVQEIASLLGETTAETKIALTKLKETLRHE